MLPPEDPDSWLTARQAAQLLRVGHQTALRRARAAYASQAPDDPTPRVRKLGNGFWVATWHWWRDVAFAERPKMGRPWPKRAPAQGEQHEDQQQDQQDQGPPRPDGGA